MPVLAASLALLVYVAACGTTPLPDGPAPPPARPAEDAREPEAEPVPERVARTVRLGVVIPRSGDPTLAHYGELILQGVRLAAESGSVDGRRVELVVRDDGGVPSRTARLVAELESEGVVGVVGPLLPAALDEAARARRDERLVLVSPTATTIPVGLTNVYSINAEDTRGVLALADYAVRAGHREVAILFPFMPPHQQRAGMFAAAVRAAGGDVVAEIGYPPGTTTFAQQMQVLQRSGARAVYIPAPAQDVRQIAPQIRYYGLRATGMQVLGGESWVSDDVLRRVEAVHLEDVVAATPLLRTSPDIGWSEFVHLYEETYRRLLENQYPALGHDAAMLILTGEMGSRRQRDLARVLTGLRGIRGATGIFSVEDGAILRQPFIVRIQNGELGLAAVRHGSAGAGGSRR